MENLTERLTAYLAHKMPDVRELEVTGLSRIYGGASRETFRFQARWQAGGTQVVRPLVLRRDPAASLIETERGREFRAYQAFYPTGLPVPEPLYLEIDAGWLGNPFMVMEQVENAQVASPFTKEPYGALARKTGEEFWRYLGFIARQDPVGLGLEEVLAPPGPPTPAWKRELDIWADEIAKDALSPQPVVEGAIRWLRRHPPSEPECIRVVHGDYRTGNFLYADDGSIRAILDWEMCHLGDPLEDLAWALDPLWAFENEAVPGGLLPRDEALVIWEDASGLRADPDRLRWWEVFSMVKGLAIWISAAKEYHAGTNNDPVMAFSSWYCTDVHNRLLSRRMTALITEERS